MTEQRRSPPAYWGCILIVVGLLLAICATVATVKYQRPADPFCDQRLSAGFPAAFICDASGESPTSSWGIIDWADLDSINYLGFVIDCLFYFFLLWLVRLSLGRLQPR